MQSTCPMAWSDTYGGHWVAAGSKEVFELARCPAVSNHHDLTGATPYRASHPQGSPRQRRARRHPRDGRARTQHLPRRAQPVPVPRRGQAVGSRSSTRSCGASIDEKIEAGPDRLRRRPRQHRARRTHAGDDGHPLKKWQLYSEPVHAVDLHTRGLARRRARRRDAPRDGHRHAHQHDRHPRQSAAGFGQRPAASWRSTARLHPTWRSWAISG